MRRRRSLVLSPPQVRSPRRGGGGGGGAGDGGREAAEAAAAPPAGHGGLVRAVCGQAAPLRPGDRVPALRGGGRGRPHLAGVPGPAGEQRGSGLSAGAGPFRRRDPPLEAAGPEGSRPGAAGRPSDALGLTAWFACGAAWPRFLSSAAAALHKPSSANRPSPPPPRPFKRPLAPQPQPRGRQLLCSLPLPWGPSRVSPPSCLLQSPGLGAAPEAALERVRAIQEKMVERQRILSLPQHFAGSKSLSRREMEIERALFQGTDHHSFLRMLYRQDEAQPKVAPETGPMAQLDAVYRELLSEPLPSLRPLEPPESPQKVPESSCSTPFTSLGAAPSAIEPVVVTEPVAYVPEEEILQSRLSKEEIRRIPRFSSYSPGEPSKVLYVKNLSRNATVNDLLPLFSRFQEKDNPPLRFRLLSGRMRGQAFLTFPTVSQAQDALELLNGFLLLGKPLILEFGRSERLASAPGPEINFALQETNSQSDKSQTVGVV